LQVGQQQSFRYQVTNLGPNTATAVVVTLERLYPDNCVGVIFCDGEVRFKEVTTEQGQCVFGEDQLTCHLNNLAAHAETTISGTVEAVYPGTIDYYFTANASQTDPNSTNNTNISSRFYVYPDYANSQCRDYTSENWAHRREHRAISCGDNLCTTGDTFEFEPDTQESTLYMGNDALSYHSLANCELANFGELGETAARIFTASDLPNSENIAFTEDGRQFVALATSSNSRIVEVTQSDSGYQATTLQTGQGCMFSGLTAKNNMLYAGCSVGTSNTGSVKLYQIDPDDPDRYSPIELDKTMVSYANGMTLDNQGNLLISNSFANSFFGSKPSIVKVELAGGDNFVAQTTPWLTGYTSGFPNGIQVDGDTLYYANASDLYSIEISPSTGTAGTVTKVYTVGSQYWIDDFAVGPDYLAISRIGNPYNNPGANGVVAIVDKNSYTEIKTILPESGQYKPSSVAISRGLPFGYGHLFVSDYYNGGLYLISRE
jgi:hypothetical protein